MTSSHFVSTNCKRCSSQSTSKEVFLFMRSTRNHFFLHLMKKKMMQCAPHFRSIQQLVRFCTIQDDADVSVPKENVHCPFVAAPWPSSTDSMDGHIFSACRALLFRVGHTESIHCL